MDGITRRSSYWFTGVALTMLCAIFIFSANLPGQGRGQGDQQAPGGGGRGARPAVAAVPKGFYDPHLNTHLLPAGGPAPRTADGHVDLTGRYYPNGAGRMVGQYTPGGVDRAGHEAGGVPRRLDERPGDEAAGDAADQRHQNHGGGGAAAAATEATAG